LVLPQTPEGYQSAWAQYSVLAKDGDERASFQAKLKERGVPTAVYYPTPLHLQTAFSDLNYTRGVLPVSEDFASRIFSLPMHPYLTIEEQERVAGLLLG